MSMRPGRGHNKKRTPPKSPKPEAKRKEMRAKETLDGIEAWEEIKQTPAKRKKL